LPECPRLRRLSCWENQLTSLMTLDPETPRDQHPELIELACWGNQLTELPLYPRLAKIDLTGTPLGDQMTDPRDVQEYHSLYRLPHGRQTKAAGLSS